jgi:hypothetical protein
MSTLAIEINDAGIVVARDESVLAIEPGYALVDKSETQTGWPAYRQSRLKPKFVSNRYWANLSLDPESAQGLAVANSAELAFLHLDKLWKEYGQGAHDGVLIVPAHYAAEQLGLMLGLAQESGMTVRAMVDCAVAGAVRPYPDRQLLYVDGSLHRISVTTIAQGEEAVASATQALASTGLASLTESFAKRIAQTFVRTTRFDPLHHAATEQSLYDRLPEWLDELRSADGIEASVPFGDDEFVTEISREQILGAAHGFYRAVVQLISQSREAGSALVVQISHRLAELPGFTAELGRLDETEVVILESGHAATAVLRRLEDLPTAAETVKLLKHLPWREPPQDTAALAPAETPVSPAQGPDERLPTHVVYRGIGYSLANGGYVIGRAESSGERKIVLVDGHSGVSRSHCEVAIRDGELRLEDLSRYGTYVNEKRVAGGMTLRLGDTIRIGSPGEELHVVRIEG